MAAAASKKTSSPAAASTTNSVKVGKNLSTNSVVRKPASNGVGWEKNKKLRTTNQVDTRLAKLIAADAKLNDASDEDNKFRNTGTLSFCLRAAILKGYIDISSDDALDQIIFRGRIVDGDRCCDQKTISLKLRDVLYQPDSGSIEEGYLRCPGCEAEAFYLTGMCSGIPGLEAGAKFHNHCCECPGFGKCMGDYRIHHCDKCGRHVGDHCVQCYPERGDDNYVDEEGDDEEEDDDDMNM